MVAKIKTAKPCARCGTISGPPTPNGCRPVRCDAGRYGGPAGVCKTCYKSYSKAHSAGRTLGPVRPEKDVSPGSEVARRLADFAARGYSLRLAANAAGVAVNTAYAVAARDGLGFEGARGGRPHRFESDPARADEFRRLAGSGATGSALARRFGIALTTVYDVASRLDVAIGGRVPPARYVAKGPPPPAPDPLSDARLAARRYLDTRAAVLSASSEDFARAEDARRHAEDDLVTILRWRGMPITVVEGGYIFGLSQGELWVRPHGRRCVKAVERGPRVYRSMPSGGIR